MSICHTCGRKVKPVKPKGFSEYHRMMGPILQELTGVKFLACNAVVSNSDFEIVFKGVPGIKHWECHSFCIRYRLERREIAVPVKASMKSVATKVAKHMKELRAL